jgi:RHS repeat-associated protein
MPIGPNAGTVMTSTLLIPNNFVLGDVEVTGVAISHTYPSDLDVFLISPAGTRAELFTDVCGAGFWVLFNTGFNLSLAATNLIGSACPPGTSIYRPEGDLAALAGEDSAGIWTLEITDDANQDGGRFFGWGLRLRTLSCPTLTPDRTFTPTPTATGTPPTTSPTANVSSTPTRTPTPQPPLGGYGGDGGLATAAYLNSPIGLAVGSDGTLYIADSGNNRIRRVGTDGIISTLSGDGTPSFGGDGGPASAARLSSPAGVALGQDGSLYIADTYNHRVRRVSTSGIITTVAGTGAAGYNGDGGPAVAARIALPYEVAAGSDGSVYIADTSNHRVRRIAGNGIINTVAGNGTPGSAGTSRSAVTANLFSPVGVTVGTDGSFYIAEYGNNRVTRVSPVLPGFAIGEIFLPAETGSEIYVFAGNGRHLRTLDALTGAVRYQFAYDNAGRVITVTDLAGNTTTVEREGNGNPTAIVAPNGQRTLLSVDANDYLAQVTNPVGESVRLSHSFDGLLRTLIDPRSGFHRFTYDARGLLVRDENPADGVKTLARIISNNSYTVTVGTALGVTTTYAVQNLSTGATRQVMIAPNGTRTEAILRPDGSQTSSSADGTVMTQTLGPDPRWGMLAPIVTTMTQTLPSGLRQTLVSTRTAQLANPNDPFSLQVLTTTVTLNGQTTVSRYDGATRTLTTTSPTGRRQITILDNKGRVVQSQIAGLTAVTYSYDNNGRLSSITQGTRTVTFTYDSEWNLVSSTDPLSRTRYFDHDAAGRLTGEILPDGRQIGYTYDPSGNMTSITPPERPNHAFTYTSADLIEDYIPPDVGAGTNQTHYSYNLDQQLTQLIRPDGGYLNIANDDAGRPNRFMYTQDMITLAYDPVTGNVATITGPAGAIVTQSYDGSLPTNAGWAGAISGSMQRSYDSNLRVASERINGGDAINFAYDGDGLLTLAGGLTLARDSQTGLLTGTTLGSLMDTVGYNGFGEITTYGASYNNTSLYSTQYTRDAVGRIDQQVETTGGATRLFAYTYDLAGRLTEVRRDGTLVAHYDYDSNGNRLAAVAVGRIITSTYDNQDRLLQYGTQVYTYTANGELRFKTDTATSETTGYTYDVLGNLTSVILPDGTEINYLVDGQSRRIGKQVNNVRVQGFLYRDGLRPIAELDGNNNVVSRFIYASRSNVPDYLVKGGATYRIIADHLGSPHLVVNTATGQIAQRLDYDAFGNVLTDSNPGFQPFGFAGGLYDLDTRLVRFGARDYEAETGRWLVKDPVGFGGGEANLYSYAANNPVHFIDPNGREVYPVDPRARELLDQLRRDPSGAALYDYLDKSPFIYRVRSNAPQPSDLPKTTAGQFKPDVVAGSRTCNVGGNVELYDAVVRREGVNPVGNLAHELTHAALFDYQYLGRSNPPDVVREYAPFSKEGGLEFFPHVLMNNHWLGIFPNTR